MNPAITTPAREYSANVEMSVHAANKPLIAEQTSPESLEALLKDGRCPAGTISEAGCLSPACECQLRRKLLCGLLIASVLLQLLLCCHTVEKKVLASQKTAAHGIALHGVLFTKAQPAGAFPAHNPVEKNLYDCLSPYRQQLVCGAGCVIVLRMGDFGPLARSRGVESLLAAVCWGCWCL